MRKSILLVFVSANALSAGVATAQQTVEPPSSPTAAAASNTSEVGLEEIVVTAQKRAENVQDTPISVQAISAKMLESAGAVKTQDIAALVPGVVFNNALTAGVVYIRGIGQSTGSLGVESPVAVHIDGVYLVNPASGLFSFNNTERVEVLKGPQGTLFGRNATGGVINVITLRPSENFDWKGSVGYGRFDTISADAYVAGGISEGLATSVSGYFENARDGFIDNPSLGRKIGQSKSYGLQNKWFWEASDRTQVGLNLFYNFKQGYLGTTLGVFPGKVADDRITTHIGPYTATSGVDTRNRDKQALAALTVSHDLGGARLVSISSWHRLWDDYNYVQNAQPLHVPLLPGRATNTQFISGESESVTQELQLLAPAGNDFQWILGGFYLHDRTSLDILDYREGRFIFQGTGANDTKASQKTVSYAAFADASKTILPNTRLTLGIRYTEDKKSVRGTTSTVTATGGIAVTTPAAPGGTFAPLETPKTWGELTYRAVLDHHFTPDIMGYASYNHGFKSGLYNITVFFNQPVDPETVDAYEVGIKSELFDRRLRLNVAGFYYDYKDLQLRQAVAQFPGRFILFNAAAASVKGLDVDFTAAVARGLTLNGGFEILDAKYDSFRNGPVALPNPVTLPLPAGCVLTGASLPASAAFLGGNTTVACDLSGRRMARSPAFTGNIGFRYDADLKGGSQLSFNLNNHYNSGFNWDSDGILKQKSYHDVRGGITWTAPSGKWDVGVWGRNLANEVIFSTASNGPTANFAIGEPRTYGIRVRARH